MSVQGVGQSIDGSFPERKNMHVLIIHAYNIYTCDNMISALTKSYFMTKIFLYSHEHLSSVSFTVLEVFAPDIVIAVRKQTDSIIFVNIS